MSSTTVVRVALFDRAGMVVGHALVDEDDLTLVSGLRWGMMSSSTTAYARAGNVYMHRLILGLKRGDGVQVDHKNGDGLDNRRSNLRQSNHKLNGQNRSRNLARSLPRGVRFEPRRGYFYAVVQIDGVQHYLGAHHAAEEASATAIAFRQQHMADSYIDQQRPPATPGSRIGKSRPGVMNGRAKLTDQQVQQIRDRYHQALSTSRGKRLYGFWKELAAEFGLNPISASLIARGIRRKTAL